VRELRPVPPPNDLRAVDGQRSSPVNSARWPSDRPAARPRAEAAEPRHPAPERARATEHDNRPEADDAADREWQDTLARFEPRRAGLPEVSAGDAARYIETRRDDRPWLNAAQSAPEEVQQVFAALDQGGGHAHIRHEGWVTAEKSQLRVQYLEDPAQLDPAKKTNGIDGLLPGNKKHYCAEISGAIRDPTAFAVIFTRGTEHPDVQQALETPLDDDHDSPSPVSLPIADLLGPDGHKYCEGYKLAGDDMNAARNARKIWLQETRAGEQSSALPPLIVPVDFRGGNIEFRFKANAAKSGYEVATLFPDPLD
jgi:hypothetical protein